MNGEHSCADTKTAVPPAPGNFLANYSLVKLLACAREVSITRSDKYYADVWLARCKNDNYVRNRTCAKYSVQLLALVWTPGPEASFYSSSSLAGLASPCVLSAGFSANFRISNFKTPVLSFRIFRSRRLCCGANGCTRLKMAPRGPNCVDAAFARLRIELRN